MRNPVGLFIFMVGVTSYVFIPKKILSLQEQLQSYIDAGLLISSDEDALNALKHIGFYRLRGYSYPFYDNSRKKYITGTSLHQILQIYEFDQDLSHCLFGFLSKIEISLRANLIAALLETYDDALILYEPVVFKNKSLFWKNLSKISSEISRSNDVFIKHNFNNHDGQIPLWAVVEVISFGTLSKIVKNLKTGKGSAYEHFANHYKIMTSKGNYINPNANMLSSWIHAVTILRNCCAHNARIYNRSINTSPELINTDKIMPPPRFNGLYQNLLAMKYLRPNNITWQTFYLQLHALLEQYQDYICLEALNFPADWEKHFLIP